MIMENITIIMIITTALTLELTEYLKVTMDAAWNMVRMVNEFLKPILSDTLPQNSRPQPLNSADRSG